MLGTVAGKALGVGASGTFLETRGGLATRRDVRKGSPPRGLVARRGPPLPRERCPARKGLRFLRAQVSLVRGVPTASRAPRRGRMAAHAGASRRRFLPRTLRCPQRQRLGSDGSEV